MLALYFAPGTPGLQVAAGRGAGRGDAGDGSLLLAHIGMQVNVGGGDLLVTEPQRDDGGVNAGVQ